MRRSMHLHNRMTTTLWATPFLNDQSTAINQSTSVSAYKFIRAEEIHLLPSSQCFLHPGCILLRPHGPWCFSLKWSVKPAAAITSVTAQAFSLGGGGGRECNRAPSDELTKELRFARPRWKKLIPINETRARDTARRSMTNNTQVGEESLKDRGHRRVTRWLMTNHQAIIGRFCDFITIPASARTFI